MADASAGREGQLVEGGILISTNDTTILAMLSRFPNMPSAEADIYISKLEHEDNKPLCLAVLGRLPPEELDEDARRTYMEFQRWSGDRTRRTRNEQVHARENNQSTRLAEKLKRLHAEGKIPEEMLLLYGISGPLPERSTYSALTEAEKQAMWEERMERNLGRNWRRRFSTLPTLLKHAVEKTRHNWKLEGF